MHYINWVGRIIAFIRFEWETNILIWIRLFVYRYKRQANFVRANAYVNWLCAKVDKIWNVFNAAFSFPYQPSMFIYVRAYTIFMERRNITFLHIFINVCKFLKLFGIGFFIKMEIGTFQFCYFNCNNKYMAYIWPYIFLK